MADSWYTYGKAGVFEQSIDLVNDDIRAVLVMNTTTADTEEDTQFLADFTLLDEFDGAGYTAGGKALSGMAWAVDAANNWVSLTAAALSWASLGAGTRAIQAVVLVKWVTTAADSPVIAYLDSLSGLPWTPTGAGGSIAWPAGGLLRGS